MNSKIISALLAERNRCAANGLMDRVAEIDVRLRILGFHQPIETATIEPELERAVRSKSRKKKR